MTANITFESEYLKEGVNSFILASGLVVSGFSYWVMGDMSRANLVYGVPLTAGVGAVFAKTLASAVSSEDQIGRTLKRLAIQHVSAISMLTPISAHLAYQFFPSFLAYQAEMGFLLHACAYIFSANCFKMLGKIDF